MKLKIPSLYAVAVFFVIFVMGQAIIKPGLSNVLSDGWLLDTFTWLISAALSLYMTKQVLLYRKKKHPVSNK